MKTRISIIVASLLFILAFGVQGQENYDGNDSISDRVLLRKEMTGGIMLHNQGMGLNFRIGKNISFFKSRILEFEFVSIKHPKQIRVINPYYFNARSYVYGKLNHVYSLRGGYGLKKLLNRKPYWGGIELRYLLMGGASLGIMKPVYLYFWDETYSIINEEKYDPENPYHGSEYIYGRAPYTKGLGEIRVSPGIFAKAALNFEFGKYNSKIRALEAGAIAEFFGLSIPIMAQNPPQNFFLTFYISFTMGKRYN
jgi:hypothetical protein